ncbi:Y-family DNA polymerase [Pseudaminobacter sp. NGMCC 1.201702]|uniref:Y-family DNA polymerase n=1 Tax=Pseudaminobacter sp. NGMCC 1.201702 TaxID=3391825 RepID=UPI0039EF0B27
MNNAIAAYRRSERGSRSRPQGYSGGLDAFYAPLEQRDNPEFSGTPVAVCGSAARGVVAAASYERAHSGYPALLSSPEVIEAAVRVSGNEYDGDEPTAGCRCRVAVCISGLLECLPSARRYALRSRWVWPAVALKKEMLMPASMIGARRLYRRFRAMARPPPLAQSSADTASVRAAR